MLHWAAARAHRRASHASARRGAGRTWLQRAKRRRATPPAAVPSAVGRHHPNARPPVAEGVVIHVLAPVAALLDRAPGSVECRPLGHWARRRRAARARGGPRVGALGAVGSGRRAMVGDAPARACRRCSSLRFIAARVCAPGRHAWSNRSPRWAGRRPHSPLVTPRPAFPREGKRPLRTTHSTIRVMAVAVDAFAGCAP